MQESSKVPFSFDFNEFFKNQIIDLAEKENMRADDLLASWIFERLIAERSVKVVPEKQAAVADLLEGSHQQDKKKPGRKAGTVNMARHPDGKFIKASDTVSGGVAVSAEKK